LHVPPARESDGSTLGIAAGGDGEAVMDDAQLRTVWQQRQFVNTTSHLSESLAILMKHRLAKRVRQLSRLAEIWDEVVPGSIREHTAMESLNSGVLTVMVDSSSHRFQLQMLLAGGLQREIQSRFPGTLSRVRLVPGQFFSVDLAGQPRYEF
jgi:hypothetical protein